MAVNTMRNWHDRGWVLGRMSAEIGGAWILWADEAELERLRRLRSWRPVGADQRRPPESRRREVAKNVDEPVRQSITEFRSR